MNIQSMLEEPLGVEYDYQDLLDLFSERVLKHGADYINNGKVDNVRRSQNGNIITGRVIAANAQIYRLFIEVSSDSGSSMGRSGRGVTINTECTCAASTHCKHAAAILLQNLADLGREPLGLGGGDELLAHMDDWLGELEALDRDVLPDEVPDDVTHQLYYFVKLADADGRPDIQLSASVVNRAIDGKVSDIAQFKSASSIESGFFPRYVTADDSHLVKMCDRLCGRFRFTGMLETFSLSEEPKKGYLLFKRLVETGRAYLVKALDENGCRQALRGKALVWSNRRQLGRLDWAVSDAGMQRLVFVPDHEDVLPIPAHPPLYLREETQRVGLLNVGLKESELNTLFSSMPDVSPDQLSLDLDHQYAALFSLRGVVPPMKFERVDGAHMPHGKVILHSTQLTGFSGRGSRASILDLVSVRFSYVDRLFSIRDDDLEMMKFEDGNLISFRRNYDAEAQLLSDLYPLRPIEEHFSEDECLELPESEFCLARSAGWKRFMIVHLPRLKALGWEIEVHPSFRHRYARVDQWQLQVDEKGEWFELSMGILVNGEWVDLLPILIKYLQQAPKKWRQEVLPKLKEDDPVFIKLDSDIELAIAAGRIRHICSTLVELFDDRLFSASGKLELPNSQFMRINELTAVSAEDQEHAFVVSGSEHLHKLALDLKQFKGLEAVKLPSIFKGKLRSYQQEGVNWLQFLRHYQLGGVLADDMGLGKTIQTIAHLTVEKSANRMHQPALIVAPTSLMGNWRSEIERFSKKLSVLILHGSQRKEHFDSITDYDIILTTYPLLVRDQKVLQNIHFHYVILDEAQLIKNVRSKASKAVRKLQSNHRLCLTGTPMENHLGELWSLFDFLMPGFLGNEKQFRKLYRNPIEKHSDAIRQQALNQRVAPFMLRRTKEQVASELPKKSEMTRSIEISGAQRDLYESIRVSLNQRVQAEIAKRGLANSQMIILDSLLKLRQVCCDPRLVKLDSAAGVNESAKLECLLSMLSQLQEEGRRVLVFSQFTSMLSLIGSALDEAGLSYGLLTGQTRDRDTVINDFQAEKFPIFLISLKAGGTGLNLTAADCVIHYDPWWNPAVERQATDRAYRIGQDKPVFVYKMIGSGTVEEKIQALQARKHALAESLLSGKGGESLSFSEEDLAILFEPLDG